MKENENILTSSDGEVLKKDSNYTFSLEKLNEIGNHNTGFTNQMLDKFIGTVTECSLGLQEALDLQDRKKLRTVAHKNIPSYNIMGLEELEDLLKYIEANAETNPEHFRIAEVVNLVEAKNGELIKEIKKYLEENAK